MSCCEKCRWNQYSFTMAACQAKACECHTEKVANYLDARTPEERERDSKITVTTTFTSEKVDTWEEDFRSLMLQIYGDKRSPTQAMKLREDIITFVKSLLTSQKAHVLQLGEGAKKARPDGAKHGSYKVRLIGIHNAAIDAYIKKIQDEI